MACVICLVEKKMISVMKYLKCAEAARLHKTYLGGRSAKAGKSLSRFFHPHLTDDSQPEWVYCDNAITSRIWPASMGRLCLGGVGRYCRHFGFLDVVSAPPTSENLWRYRSQPLWRFLWFITRVFNCSGGRISVFMLSHFQRA